MCVVVKNKFLVVKIWDGLVENLSHFTLYKKLDYTHKTLMIIITEKYP